MRTIGTDASLDVCKQEGYMMMSYDARKKFNRETEYRIFSHYPAMHTELDNEIRFNDFVSFDSLVEVYQENKKSIDSFAETHKFVDFDNPDYYDMLNLASDVIGYKGGI